MLAMIAFQVAMRSRSGARWGEGGAIGVAEGAGCDARTAVGSAMGCNRVGSGVGGGVARMAVWAAGWTIGMAIEAVLGAVVPRALGRRPIRVISSQRRGWVVCLSWTSDDRRCCWPCSTQDSGVALTNSVISAQVIGVMAARSLRFGDVFAIKRSR